MASWNAGGASHPQNLMMIRKDHHQQQQHHPHHPDSGLVAMLSSAGLRGLEPSSSSPQRGSKRSLYSAMLEPGQEESGDGEIADDGSTGGPGAGYNSSEKKRRLSVEQVRSLELSFEMENRLEPVRKMQLAQELGLQPRQVAVWFQNRRARWKTKQLERDYDVLKAAYDSLAEENSKLKAQLQKLTNNTGDDEESPATNNKHDDDGEESGAGASKVKKRVTSSELEEEETCTTPDSPTVVSSKLKESPSSDGYSSDVLDTHSPHPPATAAPPLPAEEPRAPAIKEEPLAFPYKLDEDDALRGLENEDSYNCLFGVTDEQPNWAWWDWS